MDSLFINIIKKIPSELKNDIYSFLPEIVTLFLNKDYYVTNHPVVRKYIKKNEYENYIRAMIRQDNHFVFGLLIAENFERWLFFKKYVYKKTMFSNYIYFLQEYCIINESDKCKQIVKSYLINSGLSKNQHKKNTSMNIRWTN